MLPDLPNQKRLIHKRIITPTFERARRSDPLLTRINHLRQFEGITHNYQTVDGKAKNMAYKRMEVKYEITIEDVVDGGLDVILAKVEKMGERAASKMAKHSFKTISEAISESGNSINNEGKPLTKESFLEVFKKIQIDFDEESGMASMPTVYIHPKLSESVKKMIEDAKSDPEHKKQFDEVLEQKRKEWNDREALRKLVD
jgi:hypothetical protein